MGNPTTGVHGGKDVVMATRLTRSEAAKFDAKAGYLSRAEAIRLALAVWPGVGARPSSPEVLHPCIPASPV